MNNNQRIIFNTSAMYTKIVINTVLVLFSTRYVFAALGVVDYGLYVVVGGVMGFMGFLTSAMATSSQRHLTFELGRGDMPQLNRVFNVCFGLHLLLAIFVVVLGETLGLWFLNNVLNIPEIRQEAAFWVFQFIVVATVCYVMAVPYQALLTAHEALALVALIGIFQSGLAFILALWLGSYCGDRLVAYGLLSCGIVISITVSQVIFSRLHYSESKLVRNILFEPSLIKDLAAFSGWSLFGSFGLVARSQGITFLINIYFGPIANAALGIANQVYGAISQFTQTTLQVVSPRLVKHEGAGNRGHMLDLSLIICKYGFFMACFWAVPLFAETTTVLHLWLQNPPENAVVFCRIIILTYICDQLSAGLTIPVQAIGKIAIFQVVGGLVHLSTLPLAYLLLKFGGSERVVLLAPLATVCVITFVRAYLLKLITEFSYLRWLKAVVFRGTLAVLPTVLITYLLFSYMAESPFRLFTIMIVSVGISVFSIPFVGMTYKERTHLFSILNLEKLIKNHRIL